MKKEGQDAQNERYPKETRPNPIDTRTASNVIRGMGHQVPTLCPAEIGEESVWR